MFHLLIESSQRRLDKCKISPVLRVSIFQSKKRRTRGTSGSCLRFGFTGDQIM